MSRQVVKRISKDFGTHQEFVRDISKVFDN